MTAPEPEPEAGGLVDRASPSAGGAITSVEELLSACRLTQYQGKLTEIGVRTLDDLKELDANDYETEVGMKKIEAKRLIRELRPPAE